jgi:hemerythrin
MNRYAEYHFQTEESLMERAGYSDLAEHRIFHDAFISR